MAYVVKPFSAKDLLPTIEMAVSRYAEITSLEKEVGDLSNGSRRARQSIVPRAC